MDQNDELSLWLAKGWLETSGDDVQALIVDDLEEQARSGKSLSEGIAALETPERRAGDFGMAIAGTLLAPVLVQILREFWTGYLKELEKEAEGAVAKKTIEFAKHWFFATVKGDPNSVPMGKLTSRLDELVAEKKLAEDEKVRLLAALRSDGLQQRLASQS